MTLFYFDTSGILKRYKSEKGSEFVDELFEGRKADETFASSLLTSVEVLSVASRLLKGKVLSQGEYDTLVSRFLRDFTSQFQIGAVDNSLLVAAMAVATRHQLITTDSIHLAAIQRAGSIVAGTESVLAVTSDQELIIACRAEATEVLDPEEAGAVDRLMALR